MYYKLSIPFTVLLSLLLLFESLTAQTSTPDTNPNTVIATIGSERVLMSDLIQYYERNNYEDEYSVDDLKEFMPFYIDYKLKLRYGREQGLFSDPEILDEFENYSKQAAFSYWIENEIKKSMQDEFLERSRYELKSKHVLIQLDRNSSGEQAEQARQRIEEAREKFLNDEMTMEELNQEYSSVVQGRPAGGELPWFSAGVTVKPFEDALYSLEPGEISEPVRTQFGYHIIYLEEKRERTPHRKTNHIFFRGSRNDLSPDELSQNAYAALEEGRPWEEVVREFSQDGSSVNSGGDIGWVGYGTQYSQEFIDAVLEADPDVPYTEPTETNYGYHIFKIDSVRSYTDDNQRRAELLEQLENLPRYNTDRKQVLERLANVGNFQQSEELFNEIKSFFGNADSASVSQLDLPRNLASRELYSFSGNRYAVSDFMNWLTVTHPQRQASSYSEDWLNLYREHILDSQIIPMTRKRFPEFEKETEGFLSGLVVFQISDENIWNIETADSSALRSYYERNKDRYQFGARHDYTLLASRSDSTLGTALKMARAGESVNTLSEAFDNLIVTRDSVASPADEILAAIEGLDAGSVSEKFTYRNRDAYVIYHQLLEPRTMTFEEAYHRVGSDYQPIREENFINRLRQQFNVRTYPNRIQ